MITTILLVEDDALMRESAAFGLGHAGYDVRTAASVLEAAYRLLEKRPDLVLLDVTLPDGDGALIAHGLHDAGIAFMFLSGQSAEREVARGLAAGAEDYVIKPVGLDELIARVGAVLHRTAE